MDEECDAAQGQETATGNASVPNTQCVTDVLVRSKSATAGASIRREFRKGALQKEVDTSCPSKAAKPLYRHQHHTRKAFNNLNQIRRYAKVSHCKL